MKKFFRLTIVVTILAFVMIVGVVIDNGKLLTLYGSQYGRNAVEYSELTDVIRNANSIDIIYDNVRKQGDSEHIKEKLVNMMQGGHEMPAFGVSLDNETRNAMTSGLWIELKYNQVTTHNEMPFECLLIEVQSDWSGFNIIRKVKDKYEGRCFYSSLDGNMSDLYNYLIEQI